MIPQLILFKNTLIIQFVLKMNADDATTIINIPSNQTNLQEKSFDNQQTYKLEKKFVNSQFKKNKPICDEKHPKLFDEQNDQKKKSINIVIKNSPNNSPKNTHKQKQPSKLTQ